MTANRSDRSHVTAPGSAFWGHPGSVELQSEVEPAEGGSRIIETAVFDPLGLGGLFYRYRLYRSTG